MQSGNASSKVFDPCKNCNHSHGAHDDEDGCAFCDCPTYVRTLHQLAEAKAPRPITLSDLKLDLVHDDPSAVISVKRIKSKFHVFPCKPIKIRRIGSQATQDDIAKYVMIVEDPAQKQVLVDYATNVCIQSTIADLYSYAANDGDAEGPERAALERSLERYDFKGYRPISETEVVKPLLTFHKYFPDDYVALEFYLDRFKKLNVNIPQDVLKGITKSSNFAKIKDVEVQLQKALKTVENLRAKLKQLRGE